MIRNLIKNNIILVIQMAAAAFVPLLLLPHVVSTIGLPQYGHIAVAVSAAGYAVVVVQYAFQLTGPPRILQAPDSSRDAATFLGIARAKFSLLTGSLVVLAILGWLGARFDAASLVVCLCLPLAAALNAAWYLQARGKFGDVLLCSLAGACTALAVGFGLLQPNSDLGPALAAFSLCASPFILGALSFAFALYRLPKPRLFTQDTEPVGQQLRQGALLFLSQFASAGYMLAGPILIAQFDGPSAAGTYSVMERIINPAVTLCLLTHTAAYPQLARLFTESRRQYWRLLRIVLCAYLLLSGSIALVMLTLRDQILSHFFAGTVPAQAGALLCWALLFLVASIFGPLLTGSLVVSGRNHEVLPVNLGILMLTLALGVPLAVTHGAIGWMSALAIAQATLGLYALLRWRQWRTSERRATSAPASDQP